MAPLSPLADAAIIAFDYAIDCLRLFLHAIAALYLALFHLIMPTRHLTFFADAISFSLIAISRCHRRYRRLSAISPAHRHDYHRRRLMPSPTGRTDAAAVISLLPMMPMPRHAAEFSYAAFR